MNKRVPHSVLGSLSFIININDLSPSINRSVKFIIFADDTKMIKSLKTSQKEYYRKLNESYKEEWCTINQLQLNASKTECVVFHTDKSKISTPDITLDETIKVSKTKNFLGVYIQGVPGVTVNTLIRARVGHGDYGLTIKNNCLPFLRKLQGEFSYSWK